MDINTTFQQLGIESDERFACLAPGISFLIDEFKFGRSKSKRSNDLMRCLYAIVSDYKKFDSSVSKEFAITNAMKCNESWNVFDTQTINTAVDICKKLIEFDNILDKNTPIEINVIVCEGDLPEELKELLQQQDGSVSDTFKKFRTSKINPNKIM